MGAGRGKVRGKEMEDLREEEGWKGEGVTGGGKPGGRGVGEMGKWR